MSYNLLNPEQFITSASMATNITSQVTEIKLQDNVGIQLYWTGNAVGSFDVQVSIDHKQDINGNVTNAGHWTSLGLCPAIEAEGADDTALIEINQTTAAYIRVVYTATSGTGTLNGYITAKGI